MEFFRELGIDFDNIEGCCYDNNFIIKVGVFVEFILVRLIIFDNNVILWFGSKVMFLVVVIL